VAQPDWFSQAKMKQHVCKGRTGDGDGDARRVHMDGIGQPHAAWLMDLAKDHLLVRTMQRPPGPDSMFQRAPRARRQLGWRRCISSKMPTAQIGGGGELRHHFSVEEGGKRVGPPAPARL